MLTLAWQHTKPYNISQLRAIPRSTAKAGANETHSQVISPVGAWPSAAERAAKCHI